MSVTEANSAIPSSTTAAAVEVSNSEKTDKTLLQTIKEKLAAGKDYVLAHKGTFAKIGQVGGTAALVAGGAPGLAALSREAESTALGSVSLFPFI